MKLFRTRWDKKETYIHYSVAYFPFAYSKLYSLIRQILAKYYTEE